MYFENEKKSALIVVDMQNDFIDGSLGTAEAVKIVPDVKKLVEEAKSKNVNVIFTRDTHYIDYLKTNEGRHLPVEHCIQFTDGWKISSELDIVGSTVIDKPSFGYNGWKDLLEEVEDITIVGLCTDICVVSNALIIKALYPEVPIRVIENCCAGVTPESHNAALTTMKMCQIEIV